MWRPQQAYLHTRFWRFREAIRRRQELHAILVQDKRDRIGVTYRGRSTERKCTGTGFKSAVEG